MAKIGIVSLGCAKNLVDSEVMLGLLKEAGHELTPQQEEAEVIIVNTCGFIGPAKEESIQSILEMAQLKENGSCRKLVVTGCLVERYQKEIQAEISEVDVVLGTNQVPEILQAVDPGNVLPPISESRELYLYSDETPRVLTTPRFTAYVKIAEGCDHPCSFCVIPKMRGRFRSRPIDSVVREVCALVKSGVVEVNLIAQDSTMYGQDLGNRKGLAQLLTALNRVDGLQWIRILYTYPNTIYDELLDVIAESDKVCNYVDMPLQSASRKVLKRMKRGGHRGSLTRLIEKIRQRIPDVTLRTTMIVGFPGETEEDFQESLDFVRDIEFDRLGVFPFSDEEDAASYNLDGKLDSKEKEQRAAQIMELQAEISRNKNMKLLGQKQLVLVEGPSEETELLWQARLASQAPDIDGVVYLNDGVTEAVRPGRFQTVEITETHDYDFIGRVVP
jgi:ribosomal protein S12 methylthiotransferase